MDTKQVPKTNAQSKLVQNPVPVKQKNSKNYTLMIISSDSKGRTKKFHFSNIASKVISYAVLVFVILAFCQLIFSIVTIHKLHKVEKEQQNSIEALTDERNTLTAQVKELEKQVKQQDMIVNQNDDTKQEQEEEQTVNSESQDEMSSEPIVTTVDAVSEFPSGLPLTGNANYTKAKDDPNKKAVIKDNIETVDGNIMLLFELGAGNNIIAAGTGTVFFVTTDDKFGNMVIIDHQNGYMSVYRNAGTPLVSEGAQIDKGDVIFVIGDKNTTLGYQIRQGEQYIDPETLIEISG